MLEPLPTTAPDALSAGSILVVDDEPSVLRSLARLLSHHGYSCATATSAAEARGLLHGEAFDLILSDVNMPGENGLELLEGISQTYADIATVMVTAMDDRKLAESALQMGAYGYVIKPFEANEILIAVSNALRRRTLEIENRRHRDKLEQMVQERTRELWTAVRELEKTELLVRQSREETVQRLSMAAEFRDLETHNHVQRMSRYCELIARALGRDPEYCDLIRIASAMHDVGKIGVPDAILLKPGPLSDDEFDQVKAHTVMGERMLDGSESEMLRLATTIAVTHHERWDGSGYPHGLAGEEIPLEGRIAAIADVFDALTSHRVYRKAFKLGEAIDMMTGARGTHFDPELLDLFFEHIDEVLLIMHSSEKG
ncbi:MAG TPA: HD domain-containing phosphohydrolase [Actinomycetota bacterium]|nr:HD domain-containing phosphohydrolase [Actinomycetota bacterium]